MKFFATYVALISLASVHALAVDITEAPGSDVLRKYSPLHGPYPRVTLGRRARMAWKAGVHLPPQEDAIIVPASGSETDTQAVDKVESAGAPAITMFAGVI